MTEIRIYNRNDSARERARHVVLSCSNDGIGWTVLGRREQMDDFGGGPVPIPWRWWSDQPFEAQLIRITLPEHDFLHLDQVEIFGLEIGAHTPVSF